MALCTNTMLHQHAPQRGSTNGNCYVCGKWRHNELALGVPNALLTVQNEQRAICYQFVKKCVAGSCLGCQKAAHVTLADLESKALKQGVFNRELVHHFQEQGVLNQTFAGDVDSLKSNVTKLASCVLSEGQVRSISTSLCYLAELVGVLEGRLKWGPSCDDTENRHPDTQITQQPPVTISPATVHL